MKKLMLFLEGMFLQVLKSLSNLFVIIFIFLKSSLEKKISIIVDLSSINEGKIEFSDLDRLKVARR